MEWSHTEQPCSCAARRCSRCERTIGAADLQTRYCRACQPNAEDALHAVHVTIDHNEGWCITFTSTDPAKQFVFRMVRVTYDRFRHILDRASIAPSERERIPNALRWWGCTSFYAHMNDVQFANLTCAFQHDPRNGTGPRQGHDPGNGSEKVDGLQAVRKEADLQEQRRAHSRSAAALNQQSIALR